MSAKNSPWVPDQHGAWVMVTVPLLLGAVLAGPHWQLIPLTFAWYCGYFCFFAFSWWLRASTKRKRRYVAPVTVYGAISLLACVVILYSTPEVWRFGFLFAPLVLAALYETWRGRPRSLLSGLTTVVASALLIPVAVFICDKPFTLRPWLFAIVVGLYFCSTVFVVKSLIRERANRRFWFESLGFHVFAVLVLLALVLLGHAHWLGVLVYIGLLARAWWLPRQVERGARTYTPKDVGMMEMAWTLIVIVFCLLGISG